MRLLFDVFLFCSCVHLIFLCFGKKHINSKGADYAARLEQSGLFSHSILTGGYYMCMQEAANQNPDKACTTQ